MRLGIALVTLLVSAPVLGQPKPGEGDDADGISVFEKDLDALFVQGGLTADGAAARAVKVSPTVRKAAASIDASIAVAQAAEYSRVPQVGATATYTRLSPLDPFSFGMAGMPGVPQLVFLNNSYALQGQASVQLSDYVLRYPKLIEAAKLGIDAAKAGKRASELDAALEARNTYYEWVRAKLQVLVARRQLAQVRATLAQVRALAEAQRVSIADRLRVESQEAQAEQIVDQLTQLASLREEQLRLLIGAGNEPLVIGEDIRTVIAAPAEQPLDTLMLLAAKQRYEFRAFDSGIAAREKQREAEKSGLYPRLSAFGTVDYANPNQRVFPQVEAFRLTWAAGLQLSWNINEPLIAKANMRRFDAEARELRADRANLARGTRIALLAAQQAVTLAQRSFATSQKGLIAAEESYRVRRALLAAQRATAVEIIDAETELTRARITALNARIDLRVAMAQLAYALGSGTK